jgi:hypothetical protein
MKPERVHSRIVYGWNDHLPIAIVPQTKHTQVQGYSLAIGACLLLLETLNQKALQKIQILVWRREPGRENDTYPSIVSIAARCQQSLPPIWEQITSARLFLLRLERSSISKVPASNARSSPADPPRSGFLARIVYPRFFFFFCGEQ